MSRNTAPQFRRMPGSAILTIVFLSLVAVLDLAGGNALMDLNFPVAAFLLGSGIISLALAAGIGSRQKWAATGTPMWSGLMILVLVLAGIEQAGTDPSPFGGFIGLHILVAIFATRKNTMAWCSVGVKRRSSFLSIDLDPEEEEEPSRGDRVELIGPLDEYGLRAGSAGTIVDIHDDPTAFEVEFIDDRTETTALVTLRPEQLRFLPERRP